MFEIGQRVLVIDQNPPIEGEVKKRSTWGELAGQPHENGVCYFIYCDGWLGLGRWISAYFVESSCLPSS